MTYSKEFKQQAIKLSDEIGTQKACEQLGLTYFTLGGWRKKENRKRIIDEETLPTIKKSCRGLAAEYANPALIEHEESVAAMAFSGADK